MVSWFPTTTINQNIFARHWQKQQKNFEKLQTMRMDIFYRKIALRIKQLLKAVHVVLVIPLNGTEFWTATTRSKSKSQ